MFFFAPVSIAGDGGTITLPGSKGAVKRQVMTSLFPAKVVDDVRGNSLRVTWVDTSCLLVTPATLDNHNTSLCCNDLLTVMTPFCGTVTNISLFISPPSWLSPWLVVECCMNSQRQRAFEGRQLAILSGGPASAFHVR